MSRIRFDHGFPWDLFISYSHHDNQPSESWVQAFEARLQKRLDEVSGRVTKIWRDTRRMGPGASLEPAVLEAVRDSAVFVMILSPSWHASDWCPVEYRTFQETGYRLAVANRSRTMVVERYPAPDSAYPEGVLDNLIARFFDRKPEGTPEHFVIPERETPGAKFEDLFSLFAGNLVETLRELERNPVRRPSPVQDGASVWFAPAASEAMRLKRTALEEQAKQLGFAVVDKPSDASLAVRLVGPGEAPEAKSPVTSGTQPDRHLVFVDPAAQDEEKSLGRQLTRELAGHGGLEVLTDWTEFQERLAFQLRRSEPPPASPKRPGTRVYFLHDESSDAVRAGELASHIAKAGCVVETQLARSARERANQNKFWMKESDGVLLLNGKSDPDWLAIQLRHMVQYAPASKHKGIFLDDPEHGHKTILRQRQDLQVLDAVGGKRVEPLIDEFVAKLPDRPQK
jgi:hypothetical protein